MEIIKNKYSVKSQSKDGQIHKCIVEAETLEGAKDRALYLINVTKEWSQYQYEVIEMDLIEDVV